MDALPPTLRPLLGALVGGITGVLGDRIIGIYLFGSAVSGGFDAGVSDIDLVVVTAPEVEDIDLDGLDRLHRDIVAHDPEWNDRIEIVYIGRSTLGTFRTSGGSLAVISPGEPFHVVGEVADWLQNWYLVRETGITLAGAAPADVFPPVSRAEYLAAVARYARWIAARDLGELGPGGVAYSVLSVCRALVTVRTGMPCSKQEAAAWVRGRMPEWAWLIDAALRTRRSGGTSGFDDPPSRRAAQRLIRLIGDEIEAPMSVDPGDRSSGGSG